MSQYVCEHCKGLFNDTEATDEQRLAEMEKITPSVPDEEVVRLCNECWLLLMEWLKARGWKPGQRPPA